MHPDHLKIAPHYSVQNWKSLKLDPEKPDSKDWQTAFEIFRTRIQKRFLDPTDALIEFDEHNLPKTFGFAILTIDFLVIETLQGFRKGIINHTGKSEELFTEFLIQWSAFNNCVPTDNNPKKLAKQVYRDYRCALHHSGSTTGTFRVGISGPMVTFKGDNEVKINRTCFHENLKKEFDKYLESLPAPSERELRRHFKKKMDAICGLGTA